MGEKMAIPDTVKVKNRQQIFRMMTTFISIGLGLLVTFFVGRMFVYRTIPTRYVERDGTIIEVLSFRDFGYTNTDKLVMFIIGISYIALFWITVILSHKIPLIGGISWILLTTLPLYMFLNDIGEAIKHPDRVHMIYPYTYVDIVPVEVIAFGCCIVLGILYLILHYKSKNPSKNKSESPQGKRQIPGVIWFCGLILYFLITLFLFYMYFT